jgi:hypothetical protein
MEGSAKGASPVRSKGLLGLVCGARHRVLLEVGRTDPANHLVQVWNSISV